MLPQIHTIEGYRRQGMLVCPCARCKRLNKAIHGPGLLGDRKVYQHSTDSNNSQTLEKQLIYEVATLFLGGGAGEGPRLLQQTPCHVSARK